MIPGSRGSGAEKGSVDMKLASPGRLAALLGAGVSAVTGLALCSPAAALAVPVRPSPAASASPCGQLTSPPAYKHFIIVMDENESYSDIIGSSQAPYINSLASECGLASNYHNITHDSLPNYLGITSALTFAKLLPFDEDCLPSSSCQVASSNLFHQAKSWKE